MEILSSGGIIAAFPAHERKLVLLPLAPAWEQLDFLGWIHRSGHLGFIVFRAESVVGLVFARSVIHSKGSRRFMCDICCTLHEQSGVASFTRWNRELTRSRSYMFCADLGCSLYVRDLRKNVCTQMPETLSKQEKAKRLSTNLSRIMNHMTFRS